MPERPVRVRKSPKAANDRQDRTTAFAAPADLPLDPDDGAVHRSPRDRSGLVFRHSIAGVVADSGGFRTGRLRQRPGLYDQLHRPADRVWLHLGADAPSAERNQVFLLGPGLWLQAE